LNSIIRPRARAYLSTLAGTCVTAGGDEGGEDGFGAGADGIGEGTQLPTAVPMKTKKISRETSLFNLNLSSHRL
jgi:hypothetical protein